MFEAANQKDIFNYFMKSSPKGPKSFIHIFCENLVGIIIPQCRRYGTSILKYIFDDHYSYVIKCNIFLADGIGLFDSVKKVLVN